MIVTTHAATRWFWAPLGSEAILLSSAGWTCPTLVDERLVLSDGNVRFQGRTWPVSAPAGSRVTVCWRPAECLVILWNDQLVGAYAL